MIKVCRFHAYEEWKVAQADIPKQLGEGIPKSKIKKAPYNINTDPVGATLQISNFDYLYATLYMELKKSRKSEMLTRDFHAGLQMLTQFLLIIRDMASSNDPKNKKNAAIL